MTLSCNHRPEDDEAGISLEFVPMVAFAWKHPTAGKHFAMATDR